MSGKHEVDLDTNIWKVISFTAFYLLASLCSYPCSLCSYAKREKSLNRFSVNSDQSYSELS
jgi:hypothetical protein